MNGAIRHSSEDVFFGDAFHSIRLFFVQSLPQLRKVLDGDGARRNSMLPFAEDEFLLASRDDDDVLSKNATDDK